MADKALLLGINSYKSVSQLRGCENDVLGMRGLLTDVYKFDPSNVKVLLNSEVTKAQVKPLLKWIYQDTQPGDRLVLHFSGHGSYTADLTGDEPDKRDELICLYDMDFDKKESYLLDDELRDWTLKLQKDRQLVVVLDNCHSGTGTRKIIPPETTESRAKHPAIIERATDERRAARGLTRGLTAHDDPNDPDTVIARFVEPPLEVLRKIQGAKPRGMLRREVTQALNHVLLAACRDDQTAADAHIDGEFHGAFTFHLCKILRTVGGAGLSRRDLIEKISKAISAGRFDQVPQFEGPTDQGPLFALKKGTEAEAPQPDESSTPDANEPPDVGTPSGAGESLANAPSHSRPAASPDSDLPRRMEEFLAAYNRVLAAGGAIAPGLGGLPSLTTGLPARRPCSQPSKEPREVETRRFPPES
jgi:metacaspase-1